MTRYAWIAARAIVLRGVEVGEGSTVSAGAVVARSVATLEEVALGVPVHAVSGITCEGLETLRDYAAHGRTMALLGASGVGKSTCRIAIEAELGDELDCVELRDVVAIPAAPDVAWRQRSVEAVVQRALDANVPGRGDDLIEE